MKVYIASDHAGFALKEALVAYLREQAKDVEDLGPSAYIEGDDYPDTIAPLAHKVAEDRGSFGIAIGGSGQGEAMVCNRVSGVRAAVYYGEPRPPQQPTDSAGASQPGSAAAILVLSREHNDANVLSLGARFLSEDEAKEAVSLWLETPFSNEERHVRRIAKLEV